VNKWKRSYTGLLSDGGGARLAVGVIADAATAAVGDDGAE